MITAAKEPLSLTGVDGLFLLAAAVAVFGSASAALAVCGGHTIADLWRGKDGRASTSKLQPVLWTLGVTWALTAMLIAELATNNVHSALSSGWDALMDNDLQEEYLLLLGIPMGDWWKLALIMAIFFILGWPFEWPVIILVFLPIVLPVIEKLQLGLNKLDLLIWVGTVIAVDRIKLGTPADLILHNAKIYTSDDAAPRAEAIAIRGDRIAAVGQLD